MASIEALRLAECMEELDAQFSFSGACGEAAAELRRLHQTLHNIYEVWAGSDGFIPQTAPEAYQQQLIEQMRDLAKEGMK